MEEEETVLSTWKRSEHDAALKENVEKRRTSQDLKDDRSKENIDMNQWRSQKDMEKEIGVEEREKDEVTLNDDSLSRLIEGDARDIRHHAGPIAPPRRRDQGLSSSEKKTSADQLFSASKETKTSPRPTPKTRTLKQKDDTTENKKPISNNSAANNLSADKLFDSIGKKSVSFGGINPHDDFSNSSQELNNILKFAQARERLSQENIAKKPAIVKSTDPKQQKIIPKRPERSNVKRDSGKEFEAVSSSQDKTAVVVRSGELGEGNSKKFGDNSQNKNQSEVDDLFATKENSVNHNQGVKKTVNQGDVNVLVGKSEQHTNGNMVNKQPYFEKQGNNSGEGMEMPRKPRVTDMFEEHVPEIEHVLKNQYSNQNKKDTKLSGILRRNTPLKAEKGLEEMTKSPAKIYDFQYESRDVPQRHSTPEHSFNFKRSSSLNDLNMISPGSEDDTDSLPSSRGLRNAVYNEWLERKKSNLKEQSRKKKEEKKKEEEKEKEKLEKKIEAKKAFEAWSSTKKVVLKESAKKKKEVLNTKIEEKREKNGKQLEAKKFFESWKSKKDEVLKECIKDKRTKEKEAKQKKIEDEQEKIVIAKKSYEKWKSKKDEQTKEETRSKRRDELSKTKYELEMELDKRRESEKAFEEFVNKKGVTKRRPPSPTLTQRAWSPSGITRNVNCIPDQIQPVVAIPKINRARSFSDTTTAKSFRNTGRRTSKHW